MSKEKTNRITTHANKNGLGMCIIICDNCTIEEFEELKKVIIYGNYYGSEQDEMKDYIDWHIRNMPFICQVGNSGVSFIRKNNE